MKKLKRILCAIFGVILSISCFACTPNNEDPSTPPAELNITLNDAKSMIITSLESQTNNTTLQKSLRSPLTVGNRNIFVKLGTSDVNFFGNFDFGETITGKVQRNKEKWLKYSLQSGDKLGYSDGINSYEKYNTSYTKSSFEDSYYGLILQSLDCIYVDLLFIDDAWITIYENTATKTTKDYGFALTMNIKMPNYVEYVSDKAEALGIGTEGLFGDGDYREANKQNGSVELIIKFDKFLNIIGMDMSVISLGSADLNQIELFETTFHINKSTQEITQPNWFNPSDYE